jgi:hypothetical protein
MPDLDLVTASGPQRVFTLLHSARPVLINFGEPGAFAITLWADRVQLIDAKYDGTWDLPAIGAVAAPTAVLIRPDGYVAWVGDLSQLGLVDALTTWFGPPCTSADSAASVARLSGQRSSGSGGGAGGFSARTHTGACRRLAESASKLAIKRPLRRSRSSK